MPSRLAKSRIGAASVCWLSWTVALNLVPLGQTAALSSPDWNLVQTISSGSLASTRPRNTCALVSGGQPLSWLCVEMEIHRAPPKSNGRRKHSGGEAQCDGWPAGAALATNMIEDEALQE
jgi:hypothetical protein